MRDVRCQSLLRCRASDVNGEALADTGSTGAANASFQCVCDRSLMCWPGTCVVVAVRSVVDEN